MLRVMTVTGLPGACRAPAVPVQPRGPSSIPTAQPSASTPRFVVLIRPPGLDGPCILDVRRGVVHGPRDLRVAGPTTAVAVAEEVRAQAWSSAEPSGSAPDRAALS